MKNTILALLTISMIAVLTACGASEETTTEEESEPEKEETVEGEDDTEYVTGTFMGMAFELPGDWLYQEDDSTMGLYSSDSESMIMLQSIDLSVSDDEYNDEALDILFEASFDSIKAQYTEFQEGSIEDLTVAGCKAQEMKATVTLSDTKMSDDILIVYDENGRYFYLIQYLVKDEVEENMNAYKHFLDSLSFDAAQVGIDTQTDDQDTENEQTGGITEGNPTIIDAIQSENGYDITFQKYYFYENSIGKTCVNALVQIKNTGNENLQLRSSSFSVSDADGNLVDVISMASSDPDIVQPGEYGYIYANDHSFDDDVKVDGDYTVTPELSIKETDREPVIYEVSDTTISEGKYDKADIMGRVTNTTDEDSSGLWIACVLFDKDDKPLAVYGTNVHGLDAGATVSFDADAIYLMDADFLFSDVNRYEVIAQK